MKPLLLQQSRTDQNTANREEKLHTTVAIALQATKIQLAYMERARVESDNRKDSNGSPTVESWNITRSPDLSTSGTTRAFVRRHRGGRRQLDPRYDRTKRSRKVKTHRNGAGAYFANAITPRSFELL